MRIGYSFWGFLGDYKEDDKGNALSTPDGNAAYGLFLVDAMIKAGHEVIFLQQDRDWTVFQRRGKHDFQSFSSELRFGAYLKPTRDSEGFPDLDILLLEWRFPIPGRNTPDMAGKPGYQPDLQRQSDLLNHYGDTGAKIIIWDLDYKLDEVSEAWIKPAAVLETAVSPRSGSAKRYRVEPPVSINNLLERAPRPLNTNKKLVYVGSRYERDDVIDEWIKPVSDRFPQQVEFYGNWTAEYNFAEVQARWPNVKYCDRISMKDFDRAYGDAVACPLLAKRSYLANGFITPRIWEALIFGTIPIGFKSHNGIEQYLPAGLICSDASQLAETAAGLSVLSTSGRQAFREDVANRINFMDASNFVRVIEGVYNG